MSPNFEKNSSPEHKYPSAIPHIACERMPIVPVGAPEFLQEFFQNRRSIGAGDFVTNIKFNKFFAHVTTEGCRLHSCTSSLVKHDPDSSTLETRQQQHKMIGDALKEGIQLIVPRMRVRGALNILQSKSRS